MVSNNSPPRPVFANGPSESDPDIVLPRLPSATTTLGASNNGTAPFLVDESPSASSPSIIWRLDEFAQDPGYRAYQEELRSLLFTTAQTVTAATTRQGTPEPPPSLGPPVPGQPPPDSSSSSGPTSTTNTNTTITSDPSAVHRETAAILAQGRRTAYLQNYVAVVAPWLDMFDARRTFGLQVPVLARASPALLYAVLALSARQMERREEEEVNHHYHHHHHHHHDSDLGPDLQPSGSRSRMGSRKRTRTGADGGRGSRDSSRVGSLDSLELYQEAIRRLRPLLQARDPNIILPICTVLCVMEMMSASANDWRRHLQGCAALLDVLGVHGFSGGLAQAVFWCYARMDLCGALISDGMQSTLVPPAKWLAPGADVADARELFRQAASPDMHANYAVYLCAKVCDLTAARTRFTELGEANGCDSDAFAAQWLALWDDLQAWARDRPTELLPVETIEGTPFPHILYIHWAAISSNQLYHTACTLLLDAMPRPPLNLETTGPVGSRAWHVKRICGISLTNPHQGCLNNAIQPLWIAGRLLTHESEHARIAKLLWDIEARTGWGTCWRIPDLEAAWGYRVRKDGWTTGAGGRENVTWR